MRGDGGGERVGGVDDRGDVILGEPGAQALDTTEATDPDRADRQSRVGYPAGKRADDVDIRVQPIGQCAGLGGATEEQHPHQCRSPRDRPDEYR